MATHATPGTTCPRRVVLKSRKLPAWLRLRVWASQYLYPGKNRAGWGNIVRLPFGKVLKISTGRNELEAMEFVRANTSIPLPRLYEVYERPDGTVGLVMEELPGDGTEYANMGPEQIQAFGQELAGYLQQLRRLKPPEKGFIGSVSQGPLLDYRVGQVTFGPFHRIADFHFYLRLGGPLETWTKDPVVKEVHGRSASYSVKFTHADLNPRNIQYHNGRIVGIIDWELAGWYPEYWEYTKMHFNYWPAYEDFFAAVNSEPGIEKYPEELSAERDIWRLISTWAYDDFYEDPQNAASVAAAIAAGAATAQNEERV